MIIYDPAYVVRREMLKGRPRDPSALIVHSTPIPDKRLLQYRRKEDHEGTLFDAALWVFRTGRIKACYHYLLGPNVGEIAQTCPLDLAAWHVGSKNHWRYNKWWRAKGRYEWWGKTWVASNPKQQFPNLWRGNSVNSNTIGIGFVTRAGDTGPLTDGHIENFFHVRADILESYEVSDYVRHCDVHPVSRTGRSGKPYDLSDRQWASLESSSRFDCP